ncbi:MAG TPA: sigma-54 dependent transcriptional regulator [Phycisphaerae bacterium]|nr:sigma-54 dependent transcriptional regulator [Phycisphaerae bacterium]
MASVAEKETILVVDDAPDTLELIQRNLAAAGYEVFTAPGVPEAIDVLGNAPIDLVVTDLKMPHVSGLDLARYVRENLKDTEVMMITGYPSIQGAVAAVKLGAQDYLTKPFTEEELLSAVRRILDVLKTRRQAQNGADQAAVALPGLLGESAAMQTVFQAIRKAASARATVLISGESGTGKELAARAIHYSSARASSPFVPINCGSIPENLLESELFGHVKGAFTGASESRAGFFQTADGGTIFLDEISDTSLAMQSKLLRVLENGEIYMVGSSRPRTVDVWVLAASNKDLRKLVRNGVFREDLFFRLNVINITMPPLRERENDILLLAAHFTRKFAQELGRPEPRFSDEALKVLANYHWPGNVRELENAVQRVVVMTDGDVIDVPDLPPPMRFAVTREAGVNRTLADVEGEHIRNVLKSVGGNKTRAADVLGIDRKTLREKLKLYETEPPR